MGIVGASNAVNLANADNQPTTAQSSSASSQSKVSNSSSSVSASSTSGPVTQSSATTTDAPAVKTNPDGTVAVQEMAVYAVKKMVMYRMPDFAEAQALVIYPKRKRPLRPMFVVKRYAKSVTGALRYFVEDVNQDTNTKGYTGYVTASDKYLVPAYYATVPKSKRVRVIAYKGLDSYRTSDLTQKVKHYKYGTHLKVVQIKKSALTTQYRLANGHYISANKKMVIQSR